MKKSVLILAAILIVGSLTTNAQMHQGRNQKNDQQQGKMMQNRGMMQGGMMQGGMMQGGMCPMCGKMMNKKKPMMKYMMMVNRLPNMQQKLSLTDEQVNKMIDMQADFKKQQIDYQAELTKMQMNMEKMLQSMPSADEVRRQMRQCSDTKINMRVAAYETVKRMKALLTEEQEQTLKSTMMNQGGMMQGGMMK